MFCQNCGKELREGVSFCENCGAKVTPGSESFSDKAKRVGDKLTEAADDVANSVTAGISEVGAEIKRTLDGSGTGNAGGGNGGNTMNGFTGETSSRSRESYFDGTGGTLFGKLLLLCLITIFTIGIASPWMIVNISKWEKEHTVIDGKRLTFNGTGGQLWGLWIKWWFLSLITCGIYSFFAFVDFKKWETKHTGYEGDLPVDKIYQNSFFDGNSFEYLGYSILTGLVTSVTCGIAGAWMECIMERWLQKSTVINRDRMKFDGTGGELFGQYIVVYLLSIITLGIYAAWGSCRIMRYTVSHRHVDYGYGA